MSSFNYYRPNNNPPVVLNLVIINVLAFMAQNLFHLTNFMAMWPIMPKALRILLINNNYITDSERFIPYQLFTHLFAHGGLGHIFFNMFALYTFGRVLENFWGPKKFLLFYFISGLGAAACHLAIQYYRCDGLLQALLANNEVLVGKYAGALAPAIGASGAIMGLLAAFAYLFPNTELYIMFIPVPVKAKWAVLLMGFIDLFGGVANFKGDNIAHFAHLGGAITGFLLVYFWNKTNRKTFY